VFNEKKNDIEDGKNDWGKCLGLPHTVYRPESGRDNQESGYLRRINNFLSFLETESIHQKARFS